MKASVCCGCDKFKLVVSKPPVVQLVCHCHECQAFSGLKSVKAAFFRKNDCQIVGQTTIETLMGGTGAEKFHHSCSACGEPVYVQVKALNDAVAIFADKLLPFDFAADAHIWTSQKAEGTEIPLALLQSPGSPPEEIVKRMLKGFWT
ncbi:MAG: hypothetical protein ACI910_000769 [Oleispira sp.]|jgi:hypothetical protein